MKHLTTSITVLFLLAGSNFAQSPAESITLTPPLHEIRREIPTAAGGGTAVRVVSFDPDGDMLHDLAILWSNGDVTFAYAPEIMAAFAACPVTSATAIARIPAAFALPAADGHDALLVANGTELAYLTFDPAVARSAPETAGFTVTPVVANGAWQQIVKVETFVLGSNCWLLGLGADQRTVHIAAWTSNGIEECGTALAANNVVQLLLMDPAHNGTLQVVARTAIGLEMWDAFGVPVCAIAAPAPGAVGAMTSLRDGPVDRLAWMARSASNWRLRIYCGTALQQDTLVTATEYMPNRFHALSLGTVTLDVTGAQALVVNQNSTSWQLILTRSGGGDYEATCAFEMTDITYPVDICPAILDDMDNDGQQDCTTVLANPLRVQIATALPLAIHRAFYGGDDTQQPDLLPVDCTLSQSTRTNSQPDDTIDLYLRVPSSYPDPGSLEAQVVAWPQYVEIPEGDGHGGFGLTPMSDAVANILFTLIGEEGQLLLQPVVRVPLNPESGGLWRANDQYYFMVRFVRRNGAEFVWSSPAQMVGFEVNGGSPPLAFMQSISSPTGHGTVTVRGGNRNVGLIQKPDHIDPPSMAKVPDPGEATPGTPRSGW